MFDFPAWMDEVHIVEMGRNLLSGGAASILTQPDGSTAKPFYYLGPLLQEVCFRVMGSTGPRLSSLLGLVAAAFAFRWFLQKTERYTRQTITLASFIVFSLPLFVQSVRQVRIDCWVFAVAFLVCGLLARHRIKTAAALAAVTPFIWPSAVLLFPLFLAIHFEQGNRIRDLARAAPVFLVALTVCCTPVLRTISESISSFNGYYASVGHSAVGTASFSFFAAAKAFLVPLAKESLRAPLFFLLILLGAIAAVRSRRICLLMIPVTWLMALASGMHTFRFIYLMPILLVLAADAVNRETKPRKALAILAIGTGLIGFWSILRPHHADRPDLAALLGNSPCTVLAPGYSTYYELRRLGFTQIAIGDAGGYADTNRIASLIRPCDAVLIEAEDRYAAIEESPTPYGVLRDLCLEAARKECDSVTKSLPARIGDSFCYGTRPDLSDLLKTQGYTDLHWQGAFTAWKRAPVNCR